MKRVKLIIAYDGTNYCGWQIQINGITVEEVLNKAISELTGVETAVIGASRTDSGVHAMGNVAVFDTESKIPGEKFSFALNQRLPNDIRIQKSEEVPLEWHPRFCNSTKTYEYKILNRKFDMPTQRLYTHFVYMPLNVEKMKEAAKQMGEEIEIQALPIAECSSVINEVDIVLLGPQVRFQKPQVEKLSNGTIPVEVIDMRQYGIMDGKGILESTLDKIKVK